MSRSSNEQKLITKMISLYCKAKHNSSSLCEDCTGLETYARQQMNNCPNRDMKTSCSRCTVHCYREPERSMIRRVMRYSGPRILFHAPVLTFHYLWPRKRMHKDLNQQGKGK